ncbi:hypothetical protein ABVK25_012433 [Lepraria finkii]|uniref:Uncharacterized protein n=1 Tax=Lepraria finkii TaxID=1340010 RepID=A0ABR4AG60_9LECA
MSKHIAIIAGVGPGLHRRVPPVARRFAKRIPSRPPCPHPANYESLVTEINKSGGKAIGIQTDVTSKDSVHQMVQEVNKFKGDGGVAAAIFNVAGGFVRKPLPRARSKSRISKRATREACASTSHQRPPSIPQPIKYFQHRPLYLPPTSTTPVFRYSKGAFHFSQSDPPPPPRLHPPPPPTPPPSSSLAPPLSVKGVSARFATFATIKFALRAPSRIPRARAFAPGHSRRPRRHRRRPSISPAPRSVGSRRGWQRSRPRRSRMPIGGLARSRDGVYLGGD